MFSYIDPTLIALFVFLAGLFIGRLWSYYKDRDRIDYVTKMTRSSSSYVLGISNLISGERDLAISELARSAKTDTERIEVYIILGNLYREKGRLDKAIHIHKMVLHRKDISNLDRQLAELSLGLDFLKAGLLERAKETFLNILKENPDDAEALKYLQKSYEDERDWNNAYETHEKLLKITRSKDYTISAFILAEWGIDEYRDGKFEEAISIFEEAISLNEDTYSAYEFLGKTYLELGQFRKAAEAWETLIKLSPDKAFLVLPDLYKVYRKLGTEEEIIKYCDYTLKKNDKNWRTHLFLSTIKEKEKDTEKALEHLFTALRINLNSMIVHQQIWKLFIKSGLQIKDIKRYVKLTEEILFSDPFVCTKCQYKMTEFKRRCPHCRSWDTIVEEKE